jgi:hypothetical protein
MLTLRSHFAGFFSCCSMRLFQILMFISENKRLPLQINNKKSFVWYISDENKDVFLDFFKIDPDVIVKFDHVFVENKFIPSNYCGNDLSALDYLGGNMQFMKYRELRLDAYYMYVAKYFCPTLFTISLTDELVSKYHIDVENTCVLFLRGNDKNKECKTPAYELYKTEANNILLDNPSIRFLIQSDEKEFIYEMSKTFPNNIVFHDEIRVISKDIRRTVDNNGNTPLQNYQFVKNFISIVFIMSKCKHVVCNTGNISLWIVLFRKSTNNVIQL